ncbi:MAG: hypothetical protein JWN34_1992 [Bryobacterales bacterium]|nr:hypothetical protein [Bryobacterales bacterium]
MDTDNNIIEAVAALQARIGLPITAEPIHAIVIPNDCSLKSLKDIQYPHGVPPTRIVATMALADSASFIQYFKTFADYRSRVMANPENFTFTALLDYHNGNDTETENIEPLDPEFVSHRATFPMKQSEQWKIWFGNNDKSLSQTDFAEFLEDNRRDILKPSAAEMMEIARDLIGKSEVNFASSVRLQNGSNQIKYQEVVTAGVGPAGNIEIPDEFSIRIPVFYGEQPIEITAKLRFRISGGKLTFTYRLYRPVETRDEAFNCAVAGIGSALQLPVWLGRLAE